MYKIKKELREILQQETNPNHFFELENEIILGTVPDFTINYIYILPFGKTNQEWNEIFLHPTDPKYNYFLNSLTNWDWKNLSAHPLAIPLLENNMNKICWYYLSSNPNALPLLRRYPEKIKWSYLAWNPNPESLQIIIENMKMEPRGHDAYISLSFMKNNYIMYDVDYNAIIQRIQPYKEELLQVALHPNRIAKIYNMVGSMSDIDSYI